MTKRPDGSNRGPFWSVFERSQIPMALVDRERRYVAANDAKLELYGFSREDLIGRLAGDGSSSDAAEWQELLHTGALFGERLVNNGGGKPMRVTFAAQGTDIDGQWMGLFVTVSAQLEPNGDELIAASPTASPALGEPSGYSKTLTPRELEVLRLVALGRSTPQIASDLGLSPATVRSHVRNAMVKTGAHTRAQLVALVLGKGLTEV
jgi:PAS domain S-box-containing protein